MDSLSRVQKEGRGAGGAERGRDFLGNNAALAHAGNHDAAIGRAAAHNQVDCTVEISRHRAFEPRR